MKKLFWAALVILFLFEIANVYFIMPMPGSQEMNSIDLAYFLHQWRWLFRIILGLMMVAGLSQSKWKRKWLLIIPIALLGTVIYMANFVMAADQMFYKPSSILLTTAAKNKVDINRLVIGVVYNGEAKAYPIRFLGYHHQVEDTVGGKPMIITYCTVCRTGRVYEPVVNGRLEQFRLVGMDHFNAMFEDVTTKSWWRQENGEAITGKLKGQFLPEVFSSQASLDQWLQLNPNSLVMQADSNYINSYDTTFKFESGKSKSSLTGTDSLSWKDKSWVIGLKAGMDRRAYDWNKLKEKRIIQDNAGKTPIVLILAVDEKSFFAFERPDEKSVFSLNKDTLVLNDHRFRLDGKGIDTSLSLKPIPAYQEFWHSWRTFNPSTTKN